MFSIHISNLYLKVHLILTSPERTQRSSSKSVSSSLPDETSRNWGGSRADGNCLWRRIISLTCESSRSGSTFMMACESSCSGSTSVMMGVRKPIVRLRSIDRRLWLRCCGIDTVAVEVGAITGLPLVWGSHDDVALHGAKCPPCFVALRCRCAVAAELKVAYALSRNVDGAGESESEESTCDGEVQELHVCKRKFSFCFCFCWSLRSCS